MQNRHHTGTSNVGQRPSLDSGFPLHLGWPIRWLKMYFQIPALLILCVTVMGCVSSKEAASVTPTFDPSPYAGTYTYNFTDTDEDATVEIRFRKNTERYRIVDWLADGSIRDRIRNRTVEFTGAYVRKADGKSLIVDSEFVRFKISGNRLQWLPGYDHDLFKDGIEN